jgi:hypothetical protein
MYKREQGDQKLKTDEKLSTGRVTFGSFPLPTEATPVAYFNANAGKMTALPAAACWAAAYHDFKVHVDVALAELKGGPDLEADEKHQAATAP